MDSNWERRENELDIEHLAAVDDDDDGAVVTRSKAKNARGRKKKGGQKKVVRAESAVKTKFVDLDCDPEDRLTDHSD